MGWDKFDRSIICLQDPTATPERIAQYEGYYHQKHDIAKQVNPKVIVEIGVRAGYSAWAFLMACPNAEYHGFDADNGTHGGQGGPWTWWAEKMLKARGFNVNIHAPQDTQKMDVMPIAADFYHIDGDHTSQGVYHDLSICMASSHQGSVMLVDDYDYISEVATGINKWLTDFSDKILWEYIPTYRGDIYIEVL